MHVVATAGHVDHGKSTLVRALTGMEPDRWAEERRRGLTIDLGFAWTTLPTGEHLAFVDVPGHERFVPNMLAGIGPVPAVMFVVAADEGWMPQSAEHLAALDALRVRHGLLVVTRSDLADPEPARADALRRLAATSLGAVPSVVVSGRTGHGLPELRRELAALTRRLPAPDVDADVRLWVDRSFSVRGAGTVVTGTLQAGTVRPGDSLVLASSGGKAGGVGGVEARMPGRAESRVGSRAEGRGSARAGGQAFGPFGDPASGRAGDRSPARSDGPVVQVRELQCLGEERDEVSAVARVAVNLRGVDRSRIRRGDALLTPGAWRSTTTVDVALRPTGESTAPRGGSDAWRDVLRGALVLHVGSAAVPVRARALGGRFARLTLADPLPLRVGDLGLVRDPGRHEVVAGVVVLDPSPVPLTRRGDARRRFHELAAAERPRPPGGDEDPSPSRAGGRPGATDGDRGLRARENDDEFDPGALARIWLRHRRFASADEWRVLGLPPVGRRVSGDCYADPDHWSELSKRVAAEVDEWRTRHPLSAGMPTEALRRRLDLPPPALEPLIREAALVMTQGRVAKPGDVHELPEAVDRAVRAVEADLRERPYQAPDAHRLAELGLGTRELAAAVRAGRLVAVADGIVLLPDAVDAAGDRLGRLPQPFTLSQAKRALGTTRRVAVPLLELLDRRGVTRRLPDGTRLLA